MEQESVVHVRLCSEFRLHTWLRSSFFARLSFRNKRRQQVRVKPHTEQLRNQPRSVSTKASKAAVKNAFRAST